jgi:hypothetical protein
MLSHTTAGWWLGLIDQAPKVIHVATPRRVKSLGAIRVHGRCSDERIWHRGLPAATVAQALLDLAGCVSRRTLRTALANADYRQLLDLDAVQAVLRCSRPGSAALRAAIAEHQPKLARTNSDLEIAFLELCERAEIPLPEVNVRVAGWEVDALWRRERIAVELDGGRNHSSPAQMKRDRRKDLALRTAGYTPLRYSDEQIQRQGGEVIVDLRRAGAPG